MNKYDRIIAEGKLPPGISIMELSVLSGKLGIDPTPIRQKHFDALFEELITEVEKKLGKPMLEKKA